MYIFQARYFINLFTVIFSVLTELAQQKFIYSNIIPRQHNYQLTFLTVFLTSLLFFPPFLFPVFFLTVAWRGLGLTIFIFFTSFSFAASSSSYFSFTDLIPAQFKVWHTFFH